MNKFAIFILSLVLIACANSPDSRPEIYAKGERFLTNGVMYYQKDNFTAAEQNFNHALMLYQSADNSRGALLARINLVESLLALSNFEAAEKQLAILKHQQADEALSDQSKERIVLLEVKLLFHKQLYLEALTILTPLMLQLNSLEKNDNKRLELLATAARLEAFIAKETEHQWLKQFRELMLQKKRQAKYQVILKRIDAIIATQNQQYSKALKLLNAALTYYKEQAMRRSIAACLEEMAEIKIKQHDTQQALEYFKRALTIRVWLNDQYNTEKVQKRIVKIRQRK